MLTKRSTHKMISDRSKANVTVRGQYVAPGNKPPMGMKPLYLFITASTPEELAAAEKIVNTIMNAGQTKDESGLVIHARNPQKPAASATIALPKNIGGTSKIGEKSQKVVIKLKAAECRSLGYPLLEKLSGPGDSYLKHIQQSSGATVSIRGKGTQISPDQPLHFYVSAPSTNDQAVSSAVGLAENLLQTIYKDFTTKTGQHPDSEASSATAPPPAPPPPPVPPVGAPSLPPGISGQTQNHGTPNHVAQPGYGYNPGYNQGYGQPYGYPPQGRGYGNSYYGYSNSYQGYGGGYPSPYGAGPVPGPQPQNYSAVPPPYTGSQGPTEHSSDMKVEKAEEADHRDRRRRRDSRRRRSRSPSDSPPRRRRFSEGPVKRKFEEEDEDDSPPRKRSFSEEAPKVQVYESSKCITALCHHHLMTLSPTRILKMHSITNCLVVSRRSKTPFRLSRQSTRCDEDIDEGTNGPVCSVC